MGAGVLGQLINNLSLPNLPIKLKITLSPEAFERQIADDINALPGCKATRPPASVKYSDVAVTAYQGENISRVWVEVKKSHTDNLGNTRVSYNGKTKKWSSSNQGPLAKFCVDVLNKSRKVKNMIKELGEFANITNPSLPTTKGGLKEINAVPLKTMREYFATKKDQYIFSEDDVDLGQLVTAHYNSGKAEPVHYMQAGDDFYRLGYQDPLNLGRDVPLLKGIGSFKMRVSLRTEFYEIQPEVKITDMIDSPYSAYSASTKLNPFTKKKNSK